MRYVWLFLLALLTAALTAAPACEGPRSSSSAASTEAPPASRAAMPDSLLLVNRTDTAFVFEAFHPMMARPLPQQIEVDLEAPPSSYVAASDTTALWPCDALDEYEGFTLHLYRVAPAPEDTTRTTARLARSVVLTSDRLGAARAEDDCHLVIDTL